MQYAVRGVRDDKAQGVLENIVFTELVRRGYNVYIGKTDGDKEIDFVAEKNTERVYVQVCMTYSNSDETRLREFAPLLAVKDHYPKYVVTLDGYANASTDGVKSINIADFLLKREL